MAVDPTLRDAACQPCAPTCINLVFERVVVSHITVGGTTVFWTLAPEFADPGPLEFQLQVGTSANPDADDWLDVGLPVIDQFFAMDPEQREFGKDNFSHYRVRLTTSRGTYLSDPVGGLGTLNHRDWRHAAELVRKELIWHRLNLHSQQGFLLKRRWTGTRCPICTDYQTGETRDPECPTCFGTGFVCGYFYPMACVWSSLDPTTYRAHIDPQRGTVNDQVVKARMLNVALLGSMDVWIAAKTDNRYFVQQVSNLTEVRGFAVAANVELRTIPATSIIYQIQIPQQLELLLEDIEDFEDAR